MCVCVWDRDAGAPWADITQDAQGEDIGVVEGKRALCGAGKHTCDPLLARSHTFLFFFTQTHTHIRPVRLQRVNTHSGKQANTHSGSTLHVIEHNTGLSVKPTVEPVCGVQRIRNKEGGVEPLLVFFAACVL